MHLLLGICWGAARKRNISCVSQHQSVLKAHMCVCVHTYIKLFLWPNHMSCMYATTSSMLHKQLLSKMTHFSAHHVLPGCQDYFLLFFLSGTHGISYFALLQSHFKSHFDHFNTHTQTNPAQSSLDITQLDTRELTSAPGMLVNALSSLLLVIIDASYSPVQPRKYVRFWPTLCTCRPSTSLVCLWLSASLAGVLQRKPRFCCVSHRTVWSAVAGLIALVARHSQRCHPADTGTFVVCQ